MPQHKNIPELHEDAVTFIHPGITLKKDGKIEFSEAARDLLEAKIAEIQDSFPEESTIHDTHTLTVSTVHAASDIILGEKSEKKSKKFLEKALEVLLNKKSKKIDHIEEKIEKKLKHEPFVHIHLGALRENGMITMISAPLIVRPEQSMHDILTSLQARNTISHALLKKHPH